MTFTTSLSYNIIIYLFITLFKLSEQSFLPRGTRLPVLSHRSLVTEVGWSLGTREKPALKSESADIKAGSHYYRTASIIKTHAPALVVTVN